MGGTASSLVPMGSGCFYYTPSVSFADTSLLGEASFRGKRDLEESRMYQKVSTDMNFVAREEEIVKFWRENDVFKKTVALRKGAP